MKVVRFFIKSIFILLLIFSILVFSSIIYLNQNIGESFKVKKGEILNFNTKLPVSAVFNKAEVNGSNPLLAVGEEYSVKLNLFGVIPFSTVNVEVVDEMHVAVIGTPFGMKIYTEGVLVIDLTDIENGTKIINPAKKAGIKVGDYILSVNGIKITTNEDLSEIVEQSAGEEMHFLIMRDGKKIHINCSAVYSQESKSYKIGIWIRDSSAGIGMLTFYSPATGIICGLGHGISDEDTDILLEVDSGEIVTAEIISVEKGVSGTPGKLNARLDYKTLGDIMLNSECGVYSKLSGNIDMKSLVEVALKNEVKSGKAQIYAAIDSKTPKLFDCEVEIRNSAYNSLTQNMLITVTDKELLNLTGGIVQGL